MPDATSCAPSKPPSFPARRIRFFASSTNFASPFCSNLIPFTIRPAGIISNAPGIMPCIAARVRCSSVASAALARSLASPAPAPTARVPAAAVPTPGIKPTPTSPANDPTASLSLRGTLSSVLNVGAT